MPFDKLLLITFDNGWYKKLAAIFTSLGVIMLKPTALCQVLSKV